MSPERINDYKQIARLGLPILVGQLGMVATGFADNIMVGRYSTEALASASFVNNLFNCVVFCIIGFTYGILPLVGALFGDGERQSGKIGGLMRNALAVNIVFTVLLTAIMTVVYFNLHRMGQPEELLPYIRPYFLLFLFGLLPISVFNVFAQWSYGIRNTLMPMWVVLAANVLNVAGNYLLIYGKFGCPELGLTGAGIATLAARMLCAVSILCVFGFRSSYRPFREGFVSARLSRDAVKRVWGTSLPVSMQMTFESGSFSFAAIVAGWIGTIALASYQVIVITGTLGFCLYYAVGSAIAVLVSNEASAGGSASAMRRVAWSGYHVMLFVASCSTFTFIFFARYIINVFTSDAQVLATTITLIIPLVVYQLGDATQITFANALRGTSKVMPMLWIAFVSYIVIGLPATYLMAIPAGGGVYGIVMSFSVSLFTAGALFLVYFLRATRSKA